jgi:hypothetical protein
MDKKEMSARKFIVIMTTSTYCIVIFSLVIMTIMELCKLEVLLAAFAGFASGYQMQNEWYFKREDRQTPGLKQEVV